MSHINNITIENFRQFDKLEVNGLKRVNFLIGQNNCGKTSLLEALFISINPINTRALLTISQFRNVILDTSFMVNLFRDLNEDKIKFTVDYLDDSYEISISPDKNAVFNAERNKVNLNTINYIPINNKHYDYNAISRTNLSKKFVAKLLLEPAVNFPPGINLPPSVNLHSNATYDTIGESTKLGKIFTPNANIVSEDDIIPIMERGEESEIIKLLKLFDEKIENILPFGYKGIYIELENKKRFPISIMGDGFKKYLSIVCALLVGNLSYLLIDEIENGLHYSNQKHLLRAIFKLSKERDIQIFVSTHSYETLKFLSEIMGEDEFSSQADDVNILKLSNANNQHKVFYRTVSNLKSFIETETEIRE